MQPAFISYLVLNDYLLQIRSGQLNNQLLDAVEEGGEFERQEAESFAMDEVRSILGSYFYLDFEFRSLLPFNWFKKYFAGDRIVIDFPVWVATSAQVGNIQDEEEVASTSYSIGDCVIWNQGIASNGNVNKWIGYVCKKNNSDQTFQENNWIAIGNLHDIFFVNFPYDIFQLVPSKQIGIKQLGLYRSGIDKVCWDNKLWLCRNDSSILNHQAREQFYKISEIPPPNVFPNQIDKNYNDGNYQWIDKGEFFLKSIQPVKFYEELNDGVDAWSDQYRGNWTFGDNRSNTMKQIVIAIAISKLMGRNSFQLRERSIQRDWAYRKLKSIKNGEETTLIPIIQPEQSGFIEWGGSPKIVNTF